jgi:hypothetical protein
MSARYLHDRAARSQEPVAPHAAQKVAPGFEGAPQLLQKRRGARAVPQFVQYRATGVTTAHAGHVVIARSDGFVPAGTAGAASVGAIPTASSSSSRLPAILQG